jgi:hypothetical protein
MNYRMQTSLRWARRIAVGVSVLAIGVSPALAQPTGGETEAEGFARIYRMPAVTVVDPRLAARWEVDGFMRIYGSPAPARPDDRDGLRGPGAAPAAVPATVAIAPRDFDWTDAGIGAAVALGVALVAAAGMLALYRSRRSVSPA